VSRGTLNDRVADRWAEAMNDGWLSLAPLSRSPLGGRPIRPLCGLGGCDREADHIDPDGVGYCHEHREDSPNGLPRTGPARRDDA
jgi:hypothetical protein